MVSKDGDKRMALIAALIAIPAACLAAMAVHTFVPVQSKPVYGMQISGFHQHHEGGKQYKRKGKMSPEKKEEFRKKFAAARKARADKLDAIVKLSEKRLALLKKGPCPAAAVRAEQDLLLARSTVYCSKIRLRNPNSISELAVKAYYAGKAAELEKAGVKAKKVKECTALKSEICALKLELELTGSRMFRNPLWQDAYKKFIKAPGADTLHAMLDAEKEAMPPRRRF